MKVLLADDDEDQLAVREMLVSHSGFETLAASNGKSALHMAAVSRPACAVVDLRFPTEDSGLRLIRGLKKIDSQIRILVLTGGNPESLANRPERGLIDYVLRKGEPSGNLIRKLRIMAARSTQARTAEAF